MSNDKLNSPAVDQIYQNQILLTKRIYALEEAMRNLEVQLAIYKKPSILQRIFLNTRTPKAIQIPVPMPIKEG